MTKFNFGGRGEAENHPSKVGNGMEVQSDGTSDSDRLARVPRKQLLLINFYQLHFQELFLLVLKKNCKSLELTASFQTDDLW